MKNIQTILSQIASRKARPVVRQMELPLAGSRLTKDEANFLLEIRQLRQRLASQM